MGKIIRKNVRDLKKDERRLYEAALGEKLLESQQVILEIVAVDMSDQKGESRTVSEPVAELPEWCNVYEGLSDAEIAEMEKVILDRSGWTRDSQ